MARRTTNSEKDTKFENPCFITGCNHNRDKKRIVWKQGTHKTNKSKGLVNKFTIFKTTESKDS